MTSKLALITALGAAAAAPPAVLLRNTAAPGTAMPFSGAGSGGYTGNSSQPYGAYVRLTRTTLRPPAAPTTATLTTLKPNPPRVSRPTAGMFQRLL
jgi:hypothetical protein